MSNEKEHLMFYPIIYDDSSDEEAFQGPKHQVRSPPCLITIMSFYGFRREAVGFLKRLCRATNLMINKTSGLIEKMIIDY